MRAFGAPHPNVLTSLIPSLRDVSGSTVPLPPQPMPFGLFSLDLGTAEDVQKCSLVLQSALGQQGFISWHKLKEKGCERKDEAEGDYGEKLVLRTIAWLGPRNEPLPLILQISLW